LGRGKTQTFCISQVTVSKDDTIILDGGGDKAIIEDRTEQVECHNHLLEIIYEEAVQTWLYFLGLI
jgi:hypothetical protein